MKNKSAVLYKPKHIPKASLVVQSVKSLPGMQKTRVRFLGRDDPLEKEMAALSNILAWWATVHGFARVRHDLVTKPPPFFTLSTNFLFRDWTSNLSVKKKTPVLKPHANLIGENLCPNSMIRKKHLSLTEGFSGRTDHGQLGRRQILCFQCN